MTSAQIVRKWLGPRKRNSVAASQHDLVDFQLGMLEANSLERPLAHHQPLRKDAPVHASYKLIAAIHARHVPRESACPEKAHRPNLADHQSPGNQGRRI